MVKIDFEYLFEKKLKKIKDSLLKTKIKKQISKIIRNPDIGKPMRFNRKGTRELYIPPYRIAYAWISKEKKLIFLEFYHKDNQ